MSRCSTKIRRVTALWTLAAGLAAAPAFAVDGVLEINQACVAAGCFPGDAPGFPVEIANPGSYRLTGDLTVPDDNTTAILLQATSITLDLNGFSIVGQYVCGVSPPNCPGGTARAIDSLGFATSGSQVSNGVIRDFGNEGIFLSGENLIEGLRIRHVGGSGIVTGFGSIVRGNVVSNVGLDGITLIEGLVERNIVHTTFDDGIVVTNGLVLGNTVLSAGDEDALLLSETAYGHNRFDQPPAGGVSMGDNVCGGNPC